MSTADIKSELIRKIDSLSSEHIEEVYGILLNYLNKLVPGESLESLSVNERGAIERGIAQLDRGERIPHAQVMEKAKTKYGR